jgi:hypothetical protein
MPVRGEPDYADQVPRREAFEQAHPNVEIRYHGPHWQAVVHEGSDETVITRLALRTLLDSLESLDPPSPTSPPRSSGIAPGAAEAALPNET